MTDAYDDDVVLEIENDGEEEKANAKIKKLREELKKSKAEAADYLAGWQRSKADYVNLSRRSREEAVLGAHNAITKIALSIIPVFDSLEAAKKSAEGAGAAVESGILQVIKQLETALNEHGVTRYTPQSGDHFDPTIHEPMQTVATKEIKEDNTVSETFQSGFALSGTVVRPARVSVKKYG